MGPCCMFRLISPFPNTVLSLFMVSIAVDLTEIDNSLPSIFPSFLPFSLPPFLPPFLSFFLSPSFLLLSSRSQKKGDSLHTLLHKHGHQFSNHSSMKILNQVAQVSREEGEEDEMALYITKMEEIHFP